MIPVSRFPPHLSRNPRRNDPGVPFSAPPVPKSPPHCARCPIFCPTCLAIPAETCPVSHFPPHLSQCRVCGVPPAPGRVHSRVALRLRSGLAAAEYGLRAAAPPSRRSALSRINLPAELSQTLSRCPNFRPTCHTYPAEPYPVSRNQHHLERLGLNQAMFARGWVTLRAKYGALSCL